MSPETEKVLIDIGFTKNECLIYLSLLGLGSASAGKITESSGIHRRNVYDALERLTEKGLVGTSRKGSIKHFEVMNPSRLFDIISNEKETFNEKEKAIKRVLPELMILRNTGKGYQDVSIFTGRESRKVIFEDILRTSKENLVLGAREPSDISRNYLHWWHKRRIKLGIKNRMIYNRKCSYLKFTSNLPRTKARLLSEGVNTNTAMNIYGNKVAMLFWSGDQPVSILIDNKQVADDFRDYFNFLWGISKPLQ